MQTFGPAESIGRGAIEYRSPIAAAPADGCGVIAVGSNLVFTPSPVATQVYVSQAIAAALDGIGAGVTDHGALTGLADDDHAQYYNASRLNTVLSNYVAVTGAQTIGGMKTFQDGLFIPSRTVGDGSRLVIKNPVQGAFSEPVFLIGKEGLETNGVSFRSNGAVQFVNGFSVTSLGDFLIGYGNQKGILYFNAQSFWLGDPGIEPNQTIYNFDGNSRTVNNTLWKVANADFPNQAALIQRVDWVDTSHAARKSRIVWSAFDSGGEREAIRIQATGSVAVVGVGGATASGYSLNVNGSQKVTNNLRVEGSNNSFGNSSNTGSVVEVYGLSGITTPLRVLVDGAVKFSVTDSGSLLHSGPAANFSGPVTVGPITKSVLLATSPTATAGEYRVTDSTPAQRRVWPDGTNWRYMDSGAIVT